MKIGFVKATNEIDVQWFKPLAFGYLKSFLDENLTKPASMTLLDMPEGLGTYDVIAISSTSQDYARAVEIARRVKKEHSEILTVLGGHHITHLPETLAEEFDVAVRGEGEQTFLELISYFQKNGLVVRAEKLMEIKGILFRDNGSLIASDNRPLLNLSVLPHPDRSSDGSQYVFTSRGCPFRCSFCGSSAFWDKTRFFSAEYVVAEIEQVLAHFPGLKQIPIWDDLFIADRQRLLHIIDLLEAKGINQRVNLSFTVRANLIDDQMCRSLKRFNVSGVSFGAESGSDRVLKLMNKGSTVSQNQRAIDLLHAFEIPVTCSFILGWPTETELEVRQTLDFILQNMAAGKLSDSNAVNILMPIPGTAVWDAAVREGFIDLKDFNWNRLAIFASYRDSNLKSFDEWVHHRRKNNSIYLNERYLPQERLYELMVEHYQSTKMLESCKRDKLSEKTPPISNEIYCKHANRLSTPVNKVDLRFQRLTIPQIGGSSATVTGGSLEMQRRTIHHAMCAAVPASAMNILTVGCGKGALGRDLKELDPRRKITGIELREEACQAAWAALDHVHCADVEQFDPPFQMGEFDCMLFNGIFTQVVDPWRLMQRYVEFLKQGGTLIIAIPNIRNWGLLRQILEEGTWTYTDGGLLDRAQLRFFTKKQIFDLMERNRIKVESASHLGSDAPLNGMSTWNDMTVTSGNIRLQHANAEAFAELQATHLLVVGSRQPPTDIRKATIDLVDRAYASSLQVDSNNIGEQTIQSFERILATHPNHALAHNDLGVLRYQRQEKGKALFHFERAVEIEPDNKTFAKNLADFNVVEMGRIEASQKLYCRILEASPNELEIIAALLSTCLVSNQMQAASGLCTKMLKLNPDHAEARKFLETLNGCAALSSAELVPEQVYQEAGILISAGMRHEAIAVLETLCRAYPDFFIAHNDLGVLYTEIEDLKKAREHYEKAVDLNPKNPLFLKNLGDFYLTKIGMVEAFIKLYLDALLLAPKDVEALLMLGNVYAALSLPTEANAFYRRAIAIEPDNDHARQGLERLRDVQ